MVLFLSITIFGIHVCLAISIEEVWGMSIVVLFLSIKIFLVFVLPFPMRIFGI